MSKEEIEIRLTVPIHAAPTKDVRSLIKRITALVSQLPPEEQASKGSPKLLLSAYRQSAILNRLVNDVVYDSIASARSILGRKQQPDLKRTFEGELNREFFAQVMTTFRQKKGWSIRATADKAGVAKTDIVRIEAGEATLDKCAEALTGLGFTIAPMTIHSPEN